MMKKVLTTFTSNHLIRLLVDIVKENTVSVEEIPSTEAAHASPNFGLATSVSSLRPPPNLLMRTKSGLIQVNNDSSVEVTLPRNLANTSLKDKKQLRKEAEKAIKAAKEKKKLEKKGKEKLSDVPERRSSVFGRILPGGFGDFSLLLAYYRLEKKTRNRR